MSRSHPCFKKKQQLDNRYDCCFLSATAAAGNVFVQLDFAAETASVRHRSVAIRVCDESGDIDWVKDGGHEEVMWLRGAVPAGALCVPAGLRLCSGQSFDIPYLPLCSCSNQANQGTRLLN